MQLLLILIQPPSAQLHISTRNGLQYGYWAYVLGERTTKRFGEHSKIITVDGNLASGKGKLAQQLAEKLGMRYFPEADVHYLDKSSYDGKLLPAKLNGKCSLEKFYDDPKCPDGNSYRLQSWLYAMRFLQYANALEHLLSTGQGAILERSPYSDFVFLDAMFKNGYIRKECVSHYNEVKGVSIDEFLPPHLAIYLDVPAADVHKKILEGENVTSFVLIMFYSTSEVLVYTGKEAPDVEKVVEDLEYLKFDKGPWLEKTDINFHHLRMLVEDKLKISGLTVLPIYLPEITIGVFVLQLPGRKYAEGYNEDVGDKYIWWK
uniref:NADH dehydrogenase [ubiquinone] 1 alpha subcomplex subunit 10, mitochondrial n=1 Tax=Leptobrachium leishanense TaxID=445787 RepID=A0A8C5PWH9_9ANUR